MKTPIRLKLWQHDLARATHGLVDHRPGRDLHSGSILIIEDDHVLRDTRGVLLRTEGHRTAEVRDGEEAIKLVAREKLRPDIAIVDHNLPRGLTGLQVMARLREMLGQHLPALVLTADISTEILREIRCGELCPCR